MENASRSSDRQRRDIETRDISLGDIDPSEESNTGRTPPDNHREGRALCSAAI